MLCPDEALERAAEDYPVLLVRAETSPADVHGMGCSAGILTSLGGMMSHAALVARGWGIPAVVGAEEILISDHTITIGDRTFEEGALLSIDGTSGEVFEGSLDQKVETDPYLDIAKGWREEFGSKGDAVA